LSGSLFLGHANALAWDRVHPTNTVYGLACDPQSRDALDRLWRMKARDPRKPSAILFGRRELAIAATPWLDAPVHHAMERLLPGPVTVVVTNPEQRFPLACGATPTALGIRVPDWGPQVAALGELSWPLLQTSANRSGGHDPRRLDGVDAELRADCELLLDGGPLPGTASTIVDLTTYAADGSWRLLREGALDARAVARLIER